MSDVNLVEVVTMVTTRDVHSIDLSEDQLAEFQRLDSDWDRAEYIKSLPNVSLDAEEMDSQDVQSVSLNGQMMETSSMEP